MEVEKTVRNVLNDIKKNGITALKKYSKEFDHFEGEFTVTPYEDIDAENIEEEMKNVINRMILRVRTFHEKEKEESKIFFKNGSMYGYIVRPIERIGIYVPGGKPLPSSLVMAAVPAIIAGVKEIAVVTPPKNGKINPYVLYAAKRLGIKEIYKIGGIQAIAAMAYGIGMKKVNKIFGPGNEFVNEAKRQVFGVVGIDKLAGPSEVCVITDGTVSKEYVESDLVSQLEHGKSSKAFLLTSSKEIFNNISNERIEKKYFNSIEECINEANNIAPEHMELLVETPLKYVDLIRNAGAVYLGDYTPVPAGDYFVGTNHILPTGGAAKFSSALGIWDFVKRIYVASLSREEFLKERDIGTKLAEVEGLPLHRKALEVRK